MFSFVLSSDDEMYKKDYLLQKQYEKDFESIPPRSNIYTLDKIMEVNKSKNNSFSILNSDTVESHLEKLKTFINSIDTDALAIPSQIIALRLRFFFVPEKNNTELHLLFSEITKPLYESIHFSFDSIRSKDYKYVHLAILLTTFISLKQNQFNKSYADFLKYLETRLADSIIYFSPLHSSILCYNHKNKNAIERMCNYLLSITFPPCLERCSKWHLKIEDDIIANSLSYQYYNLIVSDILRLLLTRYFTSTSYELAISCAEQILCDIKKRFFSVEQPLYCIIPEYPLPPNSNHLDGLQYKYNKVLRYIISCPKDYIAFHDSICEIYENYLSYLSDNEQHVLNLLNNTETT